MLAGSNTPDLHAAHSLFGRFLVASLHIPITPMPVRVAGEREILKPKVRPWSVMMSGVMVDVF